MYQVLESVSAESCVTVCLKTPYPPFQQRQSSSPHHEHCNLSTHIYHIQNLLNQSIVLQEDVVMAISDNHWYMANDIAGGSEYTRSMLDI